MLFKPITSGFIREIAAGCGFDLAGVSAALPAPDFDRFQEWTERGMAGEMGYLTDRRGAIRADPSHLLPGVRSVISVGLLYSGPEPCSNEFSDPARAWISRYAWGSDYHDLLRSKLEALVCKLQQYRNLSYRICVDTAPLLERSFAHRAGLGWIGKNTCLINQDKGSWFFLGEVLTTLEIEADSPPPPDRCGACTRCIDACPTAALTPYELDARLCISYFTIELRSAIPEAQRSPMGNNVFGCDICQDVCPWNRRAELTHEAAFYPHEFAPPLDRMAALTESEFRSLFRGTPVTRAKYSGFLRNVAIAMGNSGLAQFREPLTRLAALEDTLVAEHAGWALRKLRSAGC